VVDGWTFVVLGTGTEVVGSDGWEMGTEVVGTDVAGGGDAMSLRSMRIPVLLGAVMVVGTGGGEYWIGE